MPSTSDSRTENRMKKPRTTAAFLLSIVMLSAYRVSVVTARRGFLASPIARSNNNQKTVGFFRKTHLSTKKDVTSNSGGIWSFPKEHPFAFQMIVATTKTSAADLMAQMVAEGKSLSEVDWKRNAIFVVFGFCYLGGFQWYLMVNKYRHWFPTMDKFAKMSFAEKLKYPAGMLDAAKMVLFDIFVHMPMMYFPTYYMVKECVSGSSWNPVDWAQDGLTKYSKNYIDDLTAMVRLWGPSDCVQFILPIHLRMPFRHLVSFFWTAYVSFSRGAIEPSVPAVPE